MRSPRSDSLRRRGCQAHHSCNGYISGRVRDHSKIACAVITVAGDRPRGCLARYHPAVVIIGVRSAVIERVCLPDEMSLGVVVITPPVPKSIRDGIQESERVGIAVLCDITRRVGDS